MDLTKRENKIKFYTNQLDYINECIDQLCEKDNKPFYKRLVFNFESEYIKLSNTKQQIVNQLESIK